MYCKLINEGAPQVAFLKKKTPTSFVYHKELSNDTNVLYCTVVISCHLILHPDLSS